MTLETLNEHQRLVVDLQEARDMLKALEASMLKSPSYDGMPHATGAYDKVSMLVLKIEEQKETIKTYERLVQASEKKVLPWINSIRDNRTNLIFYLRFICGYEWQEVADCIGGKNTAEAVKAVCYRYLKIKV